MPREIASDLIEDKTIRLLHKFQILRDLTEAEIRMLLGIDKGHTYHKRIAKLVQYKTQEKVIREGESDSWVFWVVTGSFIVMKTNVAIAMFNHPGEVFGEMSVVGDDKRRSATVVSAERSVCLGIDMSILDDLEEAHIREKIRNGIDRLKSERLNITVNKLIKEKREVAEQQKEIENEKQRLKAWAEELRKRETALLEKEYALAYREQLIAEGKAGG